MSTQKCLGMSGFPIASYLCLTVLALATEVSADSHPPIGYLDAISATGMVTGWAADTNRPKANISVVLTVDGHDEATVIANVPRPDVKTVFPQLTGNQGFQYQLPSTLFDGQAHSLDAFALDEDGVTRVHLSLAPQSFTLSPLTPSPPQVMLPAPSSPHWSHINVLDFGRGIKYIPDAMNRATAYQWFSTHVDVAEGVPSDLRANNPTMKVFVYGLDATMAMSSSDEGLAEEDFLHAAQDTILEFHDFANNFVQTVTIPGCPDPQPLSTICRYQCYSGTDSRWVFNPKSTAYRTEKANQLLAITQLSQADGIFLDEHSPGLSNTMNLGSRTYIQAGGVIREYYDGADSYNTDVVAWLGSLRNVFGNAGKFILVNLADYTLDPRGIDQIMAAGGASTEFLHRPDRLDRNQYEQLITVASNLVASGVMLDLYGSIGYLGPSGYTAGNYGSPAARYQMWRLASYYILKEPVGSPGKVYFDPNFNIDYESTTPTSFINEWLSAYQVDVGQPSAPSFVFQQGTALCDYTIYARQYTNALILLRPTDNWSCTDYSDNSAATVSFTQPMSMLNADGSLAPPSSTIEIRNGEGVIMFPSSNTGS